MKKLILFAAILFAGVSVANAQTEKNETGTEPHTAFDNNYEYAEGDNKASTLLTVELASIQAISINTSNVTLKYSDIKDYETGVKNTIQNHLNVYSTGGYNVYAHYTDAAMTETPSKELTAEALFNSIIVNVNEVDGTYTSSKNLTTTPETNVAIASTKGAINKMYNVTYTGAGKDFAGDNGYGYMNYVKKGKAQTLTANVYYTIIAQ